ncbi:phosphoglycolate phosphatase [Paraburkholderia sp. GAS41]|jgi:phosphoglycolate phosphatase|uniref:phosphoglycolate phosphatase n=1 Tax=Paraburkholderia sp. GAS41 TaxID=3035134 RepID=UPI003D255AED
MQRHSPVTRSRPRAVLVDLDGTMVDTAPDIVEAVGRTFDEFGTARLPFATVCGFIGKGVPNLVRRSLEASGLDRRIDADHAQNVFHRHYAQTNGRLGCVFPDVSAGLGELQRLGYRLACVTNKPHELAARLLFTTGLARYLDVLVAGDSIASMKPAPEPLWHACQLLDVAHENSVLVGDSPVDVAAARAAGLPVFIVSYGYAGPDGPAALECNGLIDSLAAMPAILAARSARLHSRPSRNA